MTVNLPLLFLPNFGPMEWMVIFGIVLIIFGPQKLPEIADAMGRSIQKFKAAARETREEIESPKPQAKKDDDAK
jgi:sec-independent protein translocase protein TatA